MPEQRATYDPTDDGNAPGLGPLRIGGTTPVTGQPQKERDLPSTRSPASEEQQPALEVCRDLWRGTERVREQGVKYLPKAPGEDQRNYANRVARSAYFAAFRKTVEGLVGLVFRADPKLSDDVPPQIVEQWENIDLAGTHGDVFLRDTLQDALVAGHAAILVEFPSTNGLALTLADEAPLRPYWVPIRKDDIMSWRTAVEDGRTVLTQLVVREQRYLPDGMFGEVLKTCYRVFYRNAGVVGYSLLEVTKQRTVIELDSGIYGNQDEIPVAEIVTSGRRSMFESEPPLLDLAYLNIAHYQQWSDYATSIHMTCVPLLFTAGVEMQDDQGNAIVVGPNSALESSNPQAKAEYVSHDGAALGACRQALDDLKSDMGTMGVAMLASQKRTAETAEAKRLDKATSDSALSVTARGLQDGIERALGFHAKYLKLDDGGSVEINRDFEGAAMEPAVMMAFAALIAQGVPIDIALEELQRGRRIAEDVDLEEVAARMLADQAAKDQMAQEMFQQPQPDPA